MKPTIIIIILLIYAFADLPVEITDNFLAYLIPFCISIAGLLLCLLNFRFIKELRGKHKTLTKTANIITSVIFLMLTLFNLPFPERSGFRCKNWTDIEMLIDPNDHTVQYVSQSLEISGSIYSHRQAKVNRINSLVKMAP